MYARQLQQSLYFPLLYEPEQYATAKLVATLTPADATTDIVWTSSDEKVATVKAGTITALSAGTAPITATAGAVSATCKVTVKAAAALTCAEVVELAKDLKSGDILAGGKRIVRGYVTEYYKDPAADFEEYGNYSVYMADTKDGGKVFEAFQVKPVDGKTVVKVGDYVTRISHNHDMIFKVISIDSDICYLKGNRIRFLTYDRIVGITGGKQ